MINMAREFTQEHVMKLCLPPELYLAIIKYQAKKDLGKSYAGLLLVNKALYQENLISKEVYEKFLYRYSRKLVPDEAPQLLTVEQQREKQKLAEKARTFLNLSSQWELHPNPEWRQRWINDALNWQDKISEAKEFLKKVMILLGFASLFY